MLSHLFAVFSLQPSLCLALLPKLFLEGLMHLCLHHLQLPLHQLLLTLQLLLNPLFQSSVLSQRLLRILHCSVN